MQKSKLHLIAMYLSEGLAILCLALWAWSRDLTPLLFATIFAIVSATFHVTYLLAKLYERIEELIQRLTKDHR